MDKDFIALIAAVLQVEPTVLKEDSTAETVPEWDSLNHWLVIETLEDKYEIEFTMEEATDFKNLGDIYKTLQKKI